MDEAEVAYLVLVAASAADGGCAPCVQSCMDEAVHMHPELPFEKALDRVRPESTRQMMAEVLSSSRRLLNRKTDAR